MIAGVLDYELLQNLIENKIAKSNSKQIRSLIHG